MPGAHRTTMWSRFARRLNSQQARAIPGRSGMYCFRCDGEVCDQCGACEHADCQKDLSKTRPVDA